MKIRRPLHPRALGELLVTASRHYRHGADARRHAPADAELRELYPGWFRFLVDNDGG